MVPSPTKLEATTRKEIDDKLIAAGWAVQDKNRLNLYESLGVAVREMDTDTGPADYTLFIDGKACGILEAKREGTGQQIDRSVIAPNQIRTIIQTFKERVFKDIFTEQFGERLFKPLICLYKY